MNASADPKNALPLKDALDPPPLTFNVPDGFFALPLAETPEERSERSQQFVRALYSRGDETIWGPATPHYAEMAALLAGTGVSYSAIGLFSTVEPSESEEGTGADPAEANGDGTWHEASAGVAQCAFTVAAVPTDQPLGDTETVTQGILAVLSSDAHNDARWLDLPCGPAVSCVTLTEYQVNPDLSAAGEPAELLTGQIQVHVPFPTGPFTAVFTLYTASTDYWREFCDIMTAILRTVSFEEPEIEFEEPGGNRSPLSPEPSGGADRSA